MAPSRLQPRRELVAVRRRDDLVVIADGEQDGGYVPPLATAWSGE